MEVWDGFAEAEKAGHVDMMLEGGEEDPEAHSAVAWCDAIEGSRRHMVLGMGRQCRPVPLTKVNEQWLLARKSSPRHLVLGLKNYKPVLLRNNEQTRNRNKPSFVPVMEELATIGYSSMWVAKAAGTHFLTPWRWKKGQGCPTRQQLISITLTLSKELRNKAYAVYTSPQALLAAGPRPLVLTVLANQGWNQHKLAKELGVKSQTLHDWHIGRKMAKPEHWARLCCLSGSREWFSWSYNYWNKNLEIEAAKLGVSIGKRGLTWYQWNTLRQMQGKPMLVVYTPLPTLYPNTIPDQQYPIPEVPHANW